MRKIKEVLRLKFEARLSHEKIAAATGMSKGAVTNAVQRAVSQGLGWPLPAELDEAGLEALIYRNAAPLERYAQPDYAVIHQELKRKGVTLQLLWEDYEKAYGRSAYRYSQFCRHYHDYRAKLARSMRQVHRAGEKVFIDYSGDTVAVIDARSGEILTAEIFVATLGASKYIHGRPLLPRRLLAFQDDRIEIAAIHPALSCGVMPRALMEYAGRLPITYADYRGPLDFSG